MNRNQEYDQLLRELDGTPVELEYTVTRAMARVDSRWQKLRWLSVPVGTVAAVFLAFVVLVNSNMAFAQTVAEVPVLSSLAAAVNWSETLSAAIESGYVQTVDQTQTRDGVTVTIDHAVADARHVILHITVEGKYMLPSSLHWRVFSRDLGWSMTGTTAAASRRQEIRVSFPEGYTVPDDLVLALSRDPIFPGSAQELDPDWDFVFPLSLSTNTPSQSLPIGQQLILDGQSLRLNSLEICAASAELKLAESRSNTLRLVNLYYYLKDELGVRYDILESGELYYTAPDGSTGLCDPAVHFSSESPWFSQGKQLTLCITGITWLDEDNGLVTVDLENQAASGLPDWLTYQGPISYKNRGCLEFLSPFALPDLPFSSSFADQDGTVRQAACWQDDGGAVYYLPITHYDCSNDSTMTLTLNYTHWRTFNDPLTVPIN